MSTAPRTTSPTAHVVTRAQSARSVVVWGCGHFPLCPPTAEHLGCPVVDAKHDVQVVVLQALSAELRETLSDPTAVPLTCGAQSEPSLEHSDLFVTLTELPVDDAACSV